MKRDREIVKSALQRIRESADPVTTFLECLEAAGTSLEKIAENLGRVAEGKAHPDFPDRVPDFRTQHMASKTLLEIMGVLKTAAESRHLHLHGEPPITVNDFSKYLENPPE